MTSLKTPRATLVLILGIIASGAFGMWLAISELQESAMAASLGYLVGNIILVFFAVLALIVSTRDRLVAAVPEAHEND